MITAECKQCGQCCVNHGLIPPVQRNDDVPEWLHCVVKRLQTVNDKDNYPCVFLTDDMRCSIHDVAKPPSCIRSFCRDSRPPELREVTTMPTQCKYTRIAHDKLKCVVCKRIYNTHFSLDQVHTICGSSNTKTKPRHQADIVYITEVLCPGCPTGHYKLSDKTCHGSTCQNSWGGKLVEELAAKGHCPREHWKSHF